MSNQFRNTLIAAVILLAVLVAAPACRPCPEPPVKTVCEQDAGEIAEPTFVHNIAVESRETVTGIEWKPVKPIIVKRGEAVNFPVNGATAWFLIPDGLFKKVAGGADWAKAKSFISFKVENGSAIVMVPKDYPPFDKDVVIHFSILVRHDKDQPGQWEYVHGENPPPKMIIPPNQND